MYEHRVPTNVNTFKQNTIAEAHVPRLLPHILAPNIAAAGRPAAHTLARAPPPPLPPPPPDPAARHCKAGTVFTLSFEGHEATTMTVYSTAPRARPEHAYCTPAAARRVAGEVLHAPAADFFPDTRDTTAMFVAPPFSLKQLIRNANVAEDTEELYKGGCRVLLVELLCDSLLVTAIVQHTRTVGARVAPAASLEQIGRGLLPQVQQQPQVPHAHTTRAPQRLTPLARTRYVTSIRATPPAPTPRGVYPMKLSLTNAHARTALADVGVWRYSVTLKDVRADPDLAKFLGTVKETLMNGLHLGVNRQTEAAADCIVADARSFMGYLVQYKGWPLHMLAKGKYLMDTEALQGFWEYLGTNKALGGRGNGRAYVRTRGCRLMHFITACSVMKVPLASDELTYPGLQDWWRMVCGKAGGVPLGPKQAAAFRGCGPTSVAKAEQWDNFVKALQTLAGSVLSLASDPATPNDMPLAQKVQCCIVLGMLGPILPAQRAALIALLNRPMPDGGKYPCRHADCDIPDCHSNHVGRDSRDKLYMTSVHYKNAGRSPEFTGPINRPVTLDSATLGKLLTGLLEHQIEWGSALMASRSPEEDVGALFVDPVRGLPFR